MVPLELTSTYRQYKKDTNSIAAWLASTAKSCGYPADQLGNGPETQGPSVRLKGKARAEAKKNKSTATSSSLPLKKYIIKVKEFVPLAEFVASKRDVSVSNSLMTTLRRVIAARQSFGHKLTQQGIAPDKLSEATHAHFTNVLRKVYEALKPRAESGASTLSSDKLDIDKFANQFSHLKVYEPSGDSLNAPEFERPEPQAGERITYEAEEFAAFEELIMAVTMVVDDLNRIRHEVQWIWSSLKDGSFDLAAAAVATNTAIDLAKNIMQDVEPIFKDHGGILKVLNEWFIVIMMVVKDYKPEDLFTPDAKDNFNYDTYDDADGTYLLVCRLINSFAPIAKEVTFPTLREGISLHYDPRSDRASKTGRQKFDEDHALLMSFFADLVMVIRAIKDYVVEDELLRGIGELITTQEITFYTVFAAQVFLDIHHILRESTEKCFEVLQMNLKFFNREIEEYFKFHGSLRMDGWPASNDALLRGYQRKIRLILADPIHRIQVERYQRRGETLPASLEHHNLLKLSPVLCGLLLYHFRTGIWELGIMLANSSRSINYTMHLYNALRLEGLMSRVWNDMGIVRSLLGDSTFFVGDAPATLEQYGNKICLQMGLTAEVVASRQPGNIGRKPPVEPRIIKDRAPVSRMFIDRYVRVTGQVDWKPDQLAKIIDLSAWELQGIEEDGRLRMAQPVDPEKRKQKAKEKAKNSKGSENAKPSPDQILKGLMISLQGEALEMSIPYMSLHRQCWSLLRAIRQRCDPLLRQLYTPAYIQREAELCLIVGWIIFEHGKQGTTNLLVQAGEVADKFVQSEGAKVQGLMKDLGIRIEYNEEISE
ncbi:hypothetical protein ABKA04_003457 [Annulohypoxylon sp. FPYF3050]